LRRARGLSLEALASAAGVSRSMLSSVERGEKVASILVVDSIATALGTTLARLVGEERREAVVVLRRDEQEVAVDPAGWERRILSPVLPGVEFELMRTTLGPGVDAGEFAAHGVGAREYVAVETGVLRLTLPGWSGDLGAGDATYFAGDVVHGFANPADVPCVYYLAMDVGAAGGLAHRRVAGSRA
jgi:transcriptional regulator with XRE-family HTH domain